MRADEIEALFARAEGRGRSRAEAIDEKVERWEWASGPLPGRSLSPFADYLAPARGRLHRKEPAKPKHGTHVYGLDGAGRVLVARTHFSATAYTEIQYTYAASRCEWVAYRHDGALLGVGIALFDDAGNPVEIRSRGWDGAVHTEYVTSTDGRITQVVVEHCSAAGVTTGWTLAARWGTDGELVELTRRYRGDQAPTESIFERSR